MNPLYMYIINDTNYEKITVLIVVLVVLVAAAVVVIVEC